MGDDLGFEFFKAGKDHLESATKWQIILATVLLYLHFGIVAPFGVKSLEKTVLDIDIGARKNEQIAVAPATEKAREFADLVKQSTAQLAADLRGNLVERFQLLSTLVSLLRQMSQADAEGEAGAAIFAPPVQPQHIQQPVTPYAGPILQPMPVTLRKYLNATVDGSEQELMTGELIDYIRGEVIQPAFDQANSAMERGDLELIAHRAKEAKDAIAAAKEKAPKSANELDALVESIDALLKQVQQFRFAQPEDNQWWRSVIGKEDTIATMMAGLVTGVQDTVKSMFMLEDLRKKADEAIAAEEAAVKKLKTDIANLEANSDRLQAQMGELAGPLKLLSFKLASLAPLLPMIIAVALAACALWRAYGLQRMTEAASLPKAGEQIENMRNWLRTSVGSTAWGLAVRQGAMLLMALAWIWLAFRATRALQPTILTNWHVVIAATMVVAGARLWLWHCSRQALACGSRESSAAPAAAGVL